MKLIDLSTGRIKISTPEDGDAPLYLQTWQTGHIILAILEPTSTRIMRNPSRANKGAH